MGANYSDTILIMEITKKIEAPLITGEVIDELTRTVMKLPQADCPVAHYFGPGVYLRQVTFPAGIFAIGHKQKFEQLNIFVSGRVAMVQPDGTLQELAAPMIFTGPPGQKMGIILEQVTWLNAYPNPDDCRDIDELESRFLDKDGPWAEIDHTLARDLERQDFEKIKNEIELPEDLFVDLPEDYQSVLTIRNSDIHGKGVFASWPFEAESMIAPIRIDNNPTTIARYINHSHDPNAEIVDGYMLLARRRINGCRGGDQGEEITIDYRKGL